VKEQLEAVERWFVSRGLPHFIADYSASRDVFTRALPVLVFLFFAQIVNGINLEGDWPIWLNVVAVVGTTALFIAAWAVLNRLQGRPAFRRPDRVGIPELSVFVVVPAIPPLLFGVHEGEALTVLIGNLLLLGVVYLFASYAVGRLVGWGFRQLWRQLGDVLALVVRALPLLLLVVTFMFLNAEIWAVAADLDGLFYWLVILLFLGLATLFAVLRLPRDVGELATFDTWEVVADRVTGTPAEPLVGLHQGPHVAAPPLRRREWGNVGLSVLFTEAIQVGLVALGMFLFLMVFGVLTVTPSIQTLWTGLNGDDLKVIGDVELAGRDVVLTWELLKVSSFLAAFSCLYFTVYLLTDPTYRREFLAELLDEFRVAFAVRAVYREAVSDADSGNL